MNFMARSFRQLAVPLFALVISALPVRADELQDIDRLLKQGQHAQALERGNQYLSQKPKDAKRRFGNADGAGADAVGSEDRAGKIRRDQAGRSKGEIRGNKAG